MDSKEEVFCLLGEHRAHQVRRNKHEVYRLPNGKIFVNGATRIDVRGWRNRLAQLRKLLRTGHPAVAPFPPPVKEVRRLTPESAAQLFDHVGTLGA